LDKVAKNRRSLAVRPVLVRNCPQIMQWREVCFQDSLEQISALHRQFDPRRVTLAKLANVAWLFPRGRVRRFVLIETRGDVRARTAVLISASRNRLAGERLVCALCRSS